MNFFCDEKPDLLLAINGTEETLQIILARREDESEPYSLLETKTLIVPGRSVNFMIPSIRDSLNLFGFVPEDIKRIALISGPGSFTGLRLTFSAAAGLIAGSNGIIAGMEYLPILARGAALASGLPVWTITHSRRMQVYLQGFESMSSSEECTPSPITPPLPVTVQEAAEIITSYKQKLAAVTGTGIIKNSNFFDGFLEDNPQLKALPKQFNTPDPEDIILAANHADYSRIMPVPMYLRGSDAEENLEAITGKRGISLDEAKRILAHVTPH
ncbi:tRNA (adenosine(37)-N6)-threonylcarbamoyltransferase complex dimerization subunit type 1 TsaB [Maridesulfovibrio sp.]|uniref:tRNA (adenosine(37)-N6)-threonylcarbamoyltransferase complex dimerization subunit type 1 TsaB n=1 Tax=Maridesulfovibrio sp. TaxID=2795000 RepID=UPI002A1890BB|nr:tRNA (adenosine(37)-N6)-threonylcarbamoyltransferase complex dimerization subunit type 1 TsaB [Maridesulfovibrio sp.]